jgi:hypothetical protein
MYNTTLANDRALIIKTTRDTVERIRYQKRHTTARGYDPNQFRRNILSELEQQRARLQAISLSRPNVYLIAVKYSRKLVRATVQRKLRRLDDVTRSV